MRVEDVIRRPLLTEKVMEQREESGIVAFEVDTRANKIEVKKAVEAQFKGAKVAAVRIAKIHGKIRRQGRYAGKRPDWKKAYVSLAADSKPIDFFEGV
ncbi:MAG: 50S ribosomal protein L23 [Thermoanaerobaculia bacterium]|nr:50S ribosomal protein L23 [Thermoanaerobaculia bacterium]